MERGEGGSMVGQLTKICADVSVSSADWGKDGGGVPRGGVVVSKKEARLKCSTEMLVFGLPCEGVTVGVGCLISE